MITAYVISALGWVALGLLAAYAVAGLLRIALGTCARGGGRDA